MCLCVWITQTFHICIKFFFLLKIGIKSGRDLKHIIVLWSTINRFLMFGSPFMFCLSLAFRNISEIKKKKNGKCYLFIGWPKPPFKKKKRKNTQICIDTCGGWVGCWNDLTMTFRNRTHFHPLAHIIERTPCPFDENVFPFQSWNKVAETFFGNEARNKKFRDINYCRGMGMKVMKSY